MIMSLTRAAKLSAWLLVGMLPVIIIISINITSSTKELTLEQNDLRSNCVANRKSMSKHGLRIS